MDLKALYGSFKTPGGFKGKESFFRYVKSIHPDVTRKQINKFLLTSDTYTLHVPKRRPKKYRRIFAKHSMYQLQMDLVDLKRYKRYNRGYAYCLNIIDCFSKKAWVFPLKTKKGPETHEILKKFLTINRPRKIEVDQGGEFYNQETLQLFHDLGIVHFFVASDKKNAIVER